MLLGLPAVGCNTAGNFLFPGYEDGAYFTRLESIGIATGLQY